MKSELNFKIARTLAFVDLENACGGADRVPALHHQVRKALLQAAGSASLSVVLSTGPKALRANPNLLWEWPEARFIQGHGIDGADMALIEALVGEPVARRSSHVILVSGDHAFAEPVAGLVRAGVHVAVMANPGSLSNKLQAAASQVFWLTNFAPTKTQLHPMEAA